MTDQKEQTQVDIGATAGQVGQTRQIQIGTNLDGQEKYVLSLLMKIDYLNGQNSQIYKEFLKQQQQLMLVAKERDAILLRVNELEAKWKNHSEDNKSDSVEPSVDTDQENTSKSTDVRK